MREHEEAPVNPDDFSQPVAAAPSRSSYSTRCEALDQAVRMREHGESPDATVKRANAFERFLREGGVPQDDDFGPTTIMRQWLDGATVNAEDLLDELRHWVHYWGGRERDQIDELAAVIMDEIPGEPSKSEGAVECAIRLLREAYVPIGYELTNSEQVVDGERPVDFSSEREVEYRVQVGDTEHEVYARGYSPEDAALAIRLALTED